MSVYDDYRFTINCKTCDRVVGLVEMPNYFSCVICGTTYEDEDGVEDNALARYYHALYEGEKRAGMVEEK